MQQEVPTKHTNLMNFWQSRRFPMTASNGEAYESVVFVLLVFLSCI